VTQNGKLDRAALVTALDAHLAGKARKRASMPRNPTETAVTGAWARVLDLPEVGLDEDFFGIGGTSLLAASAVNLLRRQGYPVRVRDLFQAPTPRRLSAHIDVMAARDEASLARRESDRGQIPG
jgi:hypothetical protein